MTIPSKGVIKNAMRKEFGANSSSMVIQHSNVTLTTITAFDDNRIYNPINITDEEFNQTSNPVRLLVIKAEEAKKQQ